MQVFCTYLIYALLLSSGLSCPYCSWPSNLTISILTNTLFEVWRFYYVFVVFYCYEGHLGGKAIFVSINGDQDL